MFVEILVFEPPLSRIDKSGSLLGNLFLKVMVKEKILHFQCLVKFSVSELIHQVSLVFM